MRLNKKKKNRLTLLIILLLVGIGFAALTATLKINGTVDVSRVSWDVHFENVQITEGSVTANPAPTSDNTTTTEMTYAVDFTKPGDFFEFTTDIANDGTIDAMVNLVTNKVYAADGETEKQLPAYLKSTVTYDDGVPIEQNQELLHGTSEKIKVRVEFRTDIDASVLPSAGAETTVFKFSASYKQADENALGGNTAYTPGELVYFDPVSSSLCNASTFDLSAVNAGTSTCYKWRVIEVGDSKYKNKVTLQMDHNLIRSVDWASKADYNDDANYGSSGNTSKGPITILNSLANATSTWERVAPINYTYDTSSATLNYGVMTCTNGICKKDNTELIAGTTSAPVRVRLITGEEAAKLAVYAGAGPESQAARWNISVPARDGWYFIANSGTTTGTQEATGPTEVPLAWLTENCHSTNNVYDSGNLGYWTLSIVSDRRAQAWRIGYDGLFYNYTELSGPSSAGARPVIEIEKSKLN